MKKLLAILLLTMTVNTGTCFLIGEEETGMNKICYYDCLEGGRAITINVYEVCPLSL